MGGILKKIFFLLRVRREAIGFLFCFICCSAASTCKEGAMPCSVQYVQVLSFHGIRLSVACSIRNRLYTPVMPRPPVAYLKIPISTQCINQQKHPPLRPHPPQDCSRCPQPFLLLLLLLSLHSGWFPPTTRHTPRSRNQGSAFCTSKKAVLSPTNQSTFARCPSNTCHLRVHTVWFLLGSRSS